RNRTPQMDRTHPRRSHRRRKKGRRRPNQRPKPGSRRPNQSRPDENLENGNRVRTTVCTAAEVGILSRARNKSRARQGPSPSILSLTARGEEQNKATAI